MCSERRRGRLSQEPKAYKVVVFRRIPWTCRATVDASVIEPIPLAAGDAWHDPFRIGLRSLDNGHWQFWEDAGNGKISYDFSPETASEAALARKCQSLQTAPQSSFVLNLVAQIRAPGQHISLRGRVLTQRDASGKQVTTLGSADQLVQLLASVFGLDVPQIAAYWPRILERHTQLFGTD